MREYPCYFDNHPSCMRNDTCAGLSFTCNANCPAPTQADRCISNPCGDGYCDPASENPSNCPADCGACGDGFCDPASEDRWSCPADCDPCNGASMCPDGSCCPSTGVCPNGSFCPL